MKTIPCLLFAALFSTLFVPRARADVEADKALSGQKFLETGGLGSVGEAAAVDASGGGGPSRSAVNAEASSLSLKAASVPAPKGDSLKKAVGTAEGAVYGAVAGLIVGGALGLAGGPAGVLGGGTAGAQIGAIAGAALGACVGLLLAGKKSEGSTGLLERRQQALDDALKGA